MAYKTVEDQKAIDKVQALFNGSIAKGRHIPPNPRTSGAYHLRVRMADVHSRSKSDNNSRLTMAKLLEKSKDQRLVSILDSLTKLSLVSGYVNWIEEAARSAGTTTLALNPAMAYSLTHSGRQMLEMLMSDLYVGSAPPRALRRNVASWLLMQIAREPVETHHATRAYGRLLSPMHTFLDMRDGLQNRLIHTDGDFMRLFQRQERLLQKLEWNIGFRMNNLLKINSIAEQQTRQVTEYRNGHLRELEGGLHCGQAMDVTHLMSGPAMTFQFYELLLRFCLPNRLDGVLGGVRDANRLVQKLLKINQTASLVQQLIVKGKYIE